MEMGPRALNSIWCNQDCQAHSLPVLVYFDPNKEHIIQCDDSKKGLGAFLLQEGQLVVYISRGLMDIEQRYSNIEWELLAVVFELERLNHYTFEFRTKVQTDQEHLTSIWKKPVTSINARVQRLLLRLPKYDIDLQYLPWKKNVIADALSKVSPLVPKRCRWKVYKLYCIQWTHYKHSCNYNKTTRVPRLHSERQHPDKISRICTQRLVKWNKDCPNDLQEYWTRKELHLTQKWITIQRLTDW